MDCVLWSVNCLVIERVESSNRPLPLSNMKTNTTGGVGVPKIRAAVVRYCPCVSRNGVLGEPCPKGYVEICIKED